MISTCTLFLKLDCKFLVFKNYSLFCFLSSVVPVHIILRYVFSKNCRRQLGVMGNHSASSKLISLSLGWITFSMPSLQKTLKSESNKFYCGYHSTWIKTFRKNSLHFYATLKVFEKSKWKNTWFLCIISIHSSTIVAALW